MSKAPGSNPGLPARAARAAPRSPCHSSRHGPAVGLAGRAPGGTWAGEDGEGASSAGGRLAAPRLGGRNIQEGVTAIPVRACRTVHLLRNNTPRITTPAAPHRSHLCFGICYTSMEETSGGRLITAAGCKAQRKDFEGGIVSPSSRMKPGESPPTSPGSREESVGLGDPQRRQWGEAGGREEFSRPGGESFIPAAQQASQDLR